MGVAIKIAGLRHAYPARLPWKRGKPALRGLDMEVAEGEIFGFLGANGAGKTTTIKILVGLLRPDAGEASLLGVSSREVESRRQLGFMPENPYFYEYLTARETLAFYAALSGMPAREHRPRAEELLEFVGLADAGDVRVKEFSKGMRQRLGIAQAVCHRPRLVILDEPMSGLDPNGRRAVREMILHLHREGATVFFSSHVLADVEMLCGRVGLLAGGAVAACGPVAALLSARATAWEVGAEGVGAALRERLAGTAVRVFSPAGPEGETLFTFRERTAAEEALRQTLAAGAKPTVYRAARETLEDYFMRTTGQGRAEIGRWSGGADK